MQTFIRRVFVVAVVVALALPALGATPSEFYLTMLHKGVTAYNAGRFDSATGPLRIAAFGFVESVEHYQTAQIYLALSHDRLGNEDGARDAARRVVAAERIESRYGSLPLPADTRTAFDTVARKVLAAGDFATLSAPPTTNPNPQPQTAQPSPNTPVPPRTPASTTPPPAPVKSEPGPVVVEEKNPDPPPPQTSAVKPAPGENPPATNTTAPKPAPQRPAPARPAPVDVPARFAAAEQALNAKQLVDARAIYRELLEQPNLERADLLRVAEGFYRSRDFANALRAFEKLGALRRGEEPYRYYIAVALYETGRYAEAKAQLAAVLPYIEETPDVTRYRVRIEGAVN